MSEKKIDILKLGNELTLQRYYFNKFQISQELRVPEYIILYIIKENAADEEIYGGKTFLKEIAEKMQISIHSISKTIPALKERGLVNWLHDGNGSEGTYVTMTEEGSALLEKHQKYMEKIYGRVIEQFGTDNLIQMLDLMKRLETIMVMKWRI